MTPDLDTLSNIVLTANQWEQGGKPLDDLLTQLLPTVQQNIAGVDHLRLFHSTQAGQMAVIAMTDDAEGMLPQALAAQTTAILTDTEDRHLQQLPATDEHTITLEIVAAPEADLKSAQTQTWLQAFSLTLSGTVLRWLDRQAMSTYQTSILNDIINAEDYKSLCEIVLSATPATVQVVGIATFSPRVDAQTAPDSMRLQVIASTDSTTTPDVTDHFENWDAETRITRLTRLREGNISVVDDIRERDPESIMMVNAINQFREQGAVSFVTVGLRASGNLLGILVLGSPENLRLNQAQLNDILAITDQIGIVLENRQLITETQNSLQETQILYDLNRALLTAEDSIQILEALRKYLFPNALSLILVTFGWDEMTGELTSLISDTWSNSDGTAAQPNTELIHNLSAQEITNLKAEWETQGRQVDVIEDIEAALPERPALQYSYDEGIKSSIVIPIWDADYIRQQITITFEKKRIFSESERRLIDASRDQIGVVLENQYLLRDMQRTTDSLGNQVRILQTVNHLSARLSASQNEMALLSEAAEALQNALNVDHVVTFNRDEVLKVVEIVADFPPRDITGRQVNEQLTEIAEGRDQRQPIVVRNVSDDLPEDWAQLYAAMNVSAATILPLYDARRGNLGYISLNMDSDNVEFDDALINIAQTITAQIAVNLQNTRLLRSTQRQAQQLEQIAGFSEAIQVSLNTPELLEIALVSAPQIIPAHHISIALYDNTRGSLQLVAQQNSQEDPQINVEDGILIRDPNVTMTRAWEERLPLQINDLQTEANLKHHSRSDLRAVMTLPIFSRGNARGVMEIGSTQPGQYSPIDGAVFQQLVSQFAVAVDNAEAYTESQRLAKAKALSGDISIQLQQQLTIEQILNVTVSELGKALGAKRGRIRLDPNTTSQDNGATRHDAAE